jgi:hypothetical protein
MAPAISPLISPNGSMNGRSMQHYNHHRCHESLNNLTPADVYFGRAQAVLLDRQRIKQQTTRQRRLLNLKQAA